MTTDPRVTPGLIHDILARAGTPRLSGVILDGHEGDALAGHEWAREKAPPVGSAGPCGARVVVVVTGLAVVSRSLG